MSTPPSEPAGVRVGGERPPACLLALMFSRRIAGGALKVSLVVGAVLNLINNGQQLWAHHTASWWQVAMNVVVPFCVSSYSAARNEARRAKGI